MQNHGLLVAADTVEATLYYFLALERCCEAQLVADAARHGLPTVLISEDEAAATGKAIGTMRNGWFSGKPQFEDLERREGVRFEWKA